jgi:hypothetical protein
MLEIGFGCGFQWRWWDCFPGNEEGGGIFKQGSNILSVLEA